MSIERLAAACIFPSFPGFEAPPWVLRRLEDGIGGICLFAYNVRDPEQLASLTAALRAARPDVVIGIDEEGGDVTRLEAARGSSFPGNGALGFVDDSELTEAVAAAMGAELREAGVNLDFAPVADVRSNPDNPVIGVRSFGANVERVADHVAAFVRGLQRQGVAACAKHFPGHGSTAGDSHLELPAIQADVRDELPPFAAAVAAGVQTVMTAHVRVPGFGELPATLDARVIGGLLRDELGFDGLVIADALEMKAISGTIGVVRGAVLALCAGVDALLVGHDLGEDAVAAITAGLVAAVESGELAEHRLSEAAARVDQTAHRFPSHVRGLSPDMAPRDASGDGPARVAARRALEIAGDIRVERPPVVVELRPAVNMAAGEAVHSLGGVLGERLPGTRTVVLDETVNDVSGRLAQYRGPRIVVVRDAHRHAWMRDLVTALAPAVVVEVGVPLWRPPLGAYVATHGGSRVSYEVLADELLAAVPV